MSLGVGHTGYYRHSFTPPSQRRNQLDNGFSAVLNTSWPPPRQRSPTADQLADAQTMESPRSNASAFLPGSHSQNVPIGSNPTRGQARMISHSTGYSQSGGNSDDNPEISGYREDLHQGGVISFVGSRTHTFNRSTSTSKMHEDNSLTGNEQPYFLNDKDQIFSGYLMGQVSNVVKAGMWWVGFTPLILALFDGKMVIVGYCRIAFNLSLLVISPVAGQVVDQVFIRKVLNYASLGRAFLYGGVLPVCWVFLSTTLFWEPTDLAQIMFQVVFVCLVLCDGCIVAFAAISDIDSGGADLVGLQYGLSDYVHDSLRSKLNSIHIMAFDFSMLFLAPLVAYLAFLITDHFASSFTMLEPASVVLLTTMGLVFWITSFLSMYFYTFSMPMLYPDQKDYEYAEDKPGMLVMLKRSIVQGARLTWNAKTIRWRILFLALETAVEDGIITVAIAEYAHLALAPKEGKFVYAYTNLYTALIVAVGKFGGGIAAGMMSCCCSIDQTSGDEKYRPMFIFVFLGSFCALGIPASFHLQKHYLEESDHWLATLLMGAACFLFFFFSTMAKIGFGSMLQSLAAQTGVSGRVFGFIGTCVTTADAVLLMVFSALFQVFQDTPETAFWIMGGMVLLHGTIELLFGPCLLLNQPTQPAFLADSLAEPESSVINSQLSLNNSSLISHTTN